jgi:hypothetical protein
MDPYLQKNVSYTLVKSTNANVSNNTKKIPSSQYYKMEEVNSDDETNFNLNIKAVLPEKDEFGKTITRIDIQAINSKINDQDLTIGFVFTGPITSGKDIRMEFDISKLMQSDQITKKLAQVNELRKKRNPLLASKDDLPKFLKDAFRESPQELNSKNISVSKIFMTGYDFQLFNPKWPKLQRYREKMKAMIEKLHTIDTIQPGTVTCRVTHLTFRETTVSIS